MFSDKSFLDLEKLTGCNFPLFLCLCLLNDDSSLNLGAINKRILFLAGLTTAKKTILELWDTNADILRLWLLNMHHIVNMECSLARFNKA